MLILFRRVFTLATLLASLAFTAHAAPPESGKGPPDGQRIRMPNMKADGQFFSGALAVDVHFGPMKRPRKGPPNAEGETSDDTPPSEDKEKTKGRRKGGKGGKGGPPPGGGGGGRGGMRGGGPGGDDSPGRRGGGMREEQNPPAQFTVTLTNRGTTPLVVEVLDFVSVLGNFAVKPDKITIEPSQSAQTDPMISRLGIPTEDLPLKIRLRSGSASEEQTLTLKILPPPEPPQGQPPPPPEEAARQS